MEDGAEGDEWESRIKSHHLALAIGINNLRTAAAAHSFVAGSRESGGAAGPAEFAVNKYGFSGRF